MPLTAAEAAALALDRRELSRIHEQSHLVLVWVQHVFPHLVDPASSSLRGNLDSRSVDRLTTLLSDGVILADIVATLDPARLSPNAIRRFAPRNVFSVPVARPAPGTPISNVDARQKTVQYNNNTRLVLAAVKKLLDVVRADANIHSVPGVVDHFVGNAPAVPPVRDIRPALRLAQLVLAAAIYGPDKTYRGVFWQLPTDSLRNSLHKCLTSVAQAVELPPPDLLYADGPALAQPQHAEQPSDTARLHPSSNLDSALVDQTPAASSAQPITTVTEPAVETQIASDSPLAAPPAAGTAAAVAGTSAAVAATATAAATGVMGAEPHPTGGVVELSRKHDTEAFSSPLVDDAALAQGALLDDGMGGRKISLVTDDENHSRGSLSPLRQSSRSTDPGLMPASPDHFLDEHRVDERPVEDINPQDQLLGQDTHSATGSDDFFTPKEHTPGDYSPDPEVDDVPHVQVQLPGAQFPGVVPHHVDETVRQSVTTSITRQISIVPEFESASEHHEESLGEPSSLNLSSRDLRTPTGRGPIDFTNPAFLMSPSGSDVPEPSNQWQIYRQKTHAAEVMSPQQLFSPPPMPPRLSKSTTATQMTPPQAAPMLFRSGSPQLSVHSGEMNIYEDAQLQSKNSKGSFAPIYQSPAGAAHSLGQTVRTSQDKTQVQGQSSSEERSGSFALPPTASHGTGSGDQVDRSAFEEIGGASNERAAGNYGDPTDNTNQGFEREEEREYAGEDEDEYEYDHGEEDAPYDDGFDPEKDDVFEKVEEYDVAVSEQEDDGAGIAESGFDTNPVHAGPASSSDHAEGGPAMTAGTVGSGPISEKVRSEATGRTGSERSVDTGRESRHSDPFREAEAMMAADARYLAPSESGSVPVQNRTVPPSGYPTALQYREVPPTPPSPPTVAALVESFTTRRQMAESVEARPVSTMAPSAGLFQKLISVWKSSEESGLDGAERDTRQLDSNLAAIYRGEQNISQSATQESTLPSGDTDLMPPKSAAHAESARSRRRRAIRMEHGSPVHHDLQRAQEASTESGRLSADERGSIASFSDAFSSDRERGFMYTGQGEGYDWDEAIRGDQSAGIPVPSGFSQDQERANEPQMETSIEAIPGRNRPPLPPSPHSSRRKMKTTHSTSTQSRTVATDGNLIRVDRRHLDWLTKELLNARDMISRQELQMTFHETQRVEQEEVLLLDKQNAESVVGAMKQILSDREGELKDARTRLSMAIDGVGTTTRDRSSMASSRNSMSAESQNLSKLITDGHAKLHTRLDESDKKGVQTADQMSKETKGLWAEVQRAMLQQMTEMTEKRDEELEVLRRELEHRQMLITNLQNRVKT